MQRRYWRFKPGIMIQNEQTPCCVLIDTNTAELFQLNESAYQLTQALQNGTCLKELTERLHQTFSLNLGQARQDAQGFLQQLAHWNLIDAYDR